MKQENLDKIIAFRHVLHEHPELSNHEVHTRKLIKEFIAQNMSKYLVLDEGNWLYCMKPYQATKKTIVLRADHDAIMNSSNTPFHGCGHDGHTAILLGVMLEKVNIMSSIFSNQLKKMVVVQLSANHYLKSIM